MNDNEMEANADCIVEALKHVAIAWKQLELSSYKIYFKKCKYNKWSLHCPEMEDTNITTSLDESKHHKGTPQWRGLSQAYWLANILFEQLNKRWQTYVMERAYYREMPAVFLSRTHKELNFWDDVIS